MRLLFAALVIGAHSPEMIDGDHSREPLSRIFGTLSLGELAVGGFFLISGYLITASVMSGAGLGDYFRKRVLRIYPAFLVCTLICVFLVAPLVGGDIQFGPLGWVRLAGRTLALQAPDVPGVLTGLPYATLNGSMWTIVYEFRCYILAALFGLLGLYRRRGLYLGLTAAMILGNLLFALPAVAAATHLHGAANALLGEPVLTVKTLAAFMAGACFKLFAVRWDGRWALGCTAAMVGLMFFSPLAWIGLITFGAYALFWAAFKVAWPWFRRLNRDDDISYGVYLYAWPIGALTLWYWRDVSPLTLGTITLAGAVVAGALSWWLIEKPAVRRPQRAAVA